MLKYLLALAVAVAFFVGGFYVFNAYIYNVKQGGSEDYKQITITIDGEPLTVGTEGTAYFGNDAKGDINDDGIPDLAYLITHQTGGSGTFYYVVGALQNSAGRYIGTNAILLGDRIAPQASEVRNGILIVNYADRTPQDPFTTPPHVGKSAYLFFDGELKAEWPVQLFYYNSELDKDASGNILCSAKGLVPVARLMPDATIDDAIRAHIEGKIAEGERSQGVSTEFPLDGFSFVSSSLVDGVLTLTFNDPQNKTSGGACRSSVLWAQVEATAKQFPGVMEVKFAPEELFQP
jgi:hypothetical protein